MIDEWQLHSMRSQQTESFPDLVDIKRLVRTADGKGGFSTGVPDVIADEVPASITPAQQMMAGGQADRGLELEKWTVRLPWGTDVQDGDVLEWAKEGIQLQVENAKVSKTRGTAVTCSAEVVKGAPW
jgi:hypothetical protein